MSYLEYRPLIPLKKEMPLAEKLQNSGKALIENAK